MGKKIVSDSQRKAIFANMARRAATRPVSKAQVYKIQAHRNPIARGLDATKTAKTVYRLSDPKGRAKWGKNPGKVDLATIDTKVSKVGAARRVALCNSKNGSKTPAKKKAASKKKVAKKKAVGARKAAGRKRVTQKRKALTPAQIAAKRRAYRKTVSNPIKTRVEQEKAARKALRRANSPSGLSARYLFGPKEEKEVAKEEAKSQGSFFEAILDPLKDLGGVKEEDQGFFKGGEKIEPKSDKEPEWYDTIDWGQKTDVEPTPIDKIVSGLDKLTPDFIFDSKEEKKEEEEKKPEQNYPL